MIKNLRSIFVVALMAVSGSMFAQETTDKESPVKTKVVFENIYKDMAAENQAGTVVYLDKHPIEQDGIKITFAKGGGTGAPNYTIEKKQIFLFAPDATKENASTEGNTITYTTTDKYITGISMNAAKITANATVKVNVGTVVMGGANGLCPLWSNKDANGKVIDVKEVVFTVIPNAENPTAKDQLHLVDTQIFTLTSSPATGINNITAAKAQNGVRYNLAGQRVSKDFKGVVIENGKKMIVK